MAAERTSLRVVGRSLPRVDGDAKARGTAVYPQDRPFPEGGLHVATVRAPVARARLRGIATGEALAVPGVVRVLTAGDVRGTNRFGLVEADQPVLATDVVRGASDVVALVAAESARAAREGARHVRLDLDVETPLVDPERACEPAAPLVHAERRTGGTHPNLLHERVVRRGDAARVLARSAVVIESEYRTPWVEHAFLAPEAGTVEIDGDGRLVLFVATQWPEADLRQAAAALGAPLARLRLVQQAIGGAFGGREDVSLQILLLLAAQVLGRPVRMVWDRRESIRGHGKRHPFRIRHRLGADAAGRFTGMAIDVLIDAGCYASTSAGLLDNALSQAGGPYAIPHVMLTGRAVYTNNPYTCAFRGFGVNQVTFAMEQQVAKVAAALGLDPATVRRRNFVASGGRLASGGTVGTVAGLPRTLAAATARARRRRLPAARGAVLHGRGLACALKNVGYGFGYADRATAEVTVRRRDAIVRIGAADVGQGIATVLVQIAAECLGLPPRCIRLACDDATVAPEAGSSSASRQSLMAGNAVRLACRAAKRAVAARGGRRGLPSDGVTRRATFRAPATQPLGARRAGPHAHAYTASTCIADVAVDAETGHVTVVRVVSALDAGRALNPRLVAAQAEGGAVMGQGYALQERCLVRDGMPTTLGFERCGVPTVADAAPAIETILVESREPAGPFGARGVGEVTMLPIVPAILAAIHDATGVWIDALPASPERVLAALAAHRGREHAPP